jgi:hypothetical protein
MSRYVRRICSVTVVLWLSVPLLPVIVRVYVPILAELVVRIFSVELLLVELGVKDVVAPGGAPLTVKSTLPLKPPVGLTVIV